MYVVLTAREASGFQANAPSYASIVTTLTPLNGVFSGSREAKPWIGRWVGPSPRVTRTTQIGSPTAGFLTNVAWAWEWNDAVVPAAQVSGRNQQLIDAAGRALADSASGWGDIAVTAYHPNLNGQIQFWTSGDASVTQTREVFPTGLSRLGTDQNPVGPTTAQTVPTPTLDLFGGGDGPLGETNKLLKTVAIVGGIGLVVYLAWPWLSGARQVKQVRNRIYG